MVDSALARAASSRTPISTSALVFDSCQYIVVPSLEFVLERCVEINGFFDLTRLFFFSALLILNPSVEQNYNQCVSFHEASTIEPVMTFFEFPERLTLIVNRFESLMNAVACAHAG